LTPLSAYVLTHNSERLLARVLAPLVAIADEIVIADSGSTDRTVEIAREYGCRIERRDFTDFADQRTWALSLCRHDHVLFVDSDEIVSVALATRILELKRQGFPHDIYYVRRDWNVFGRPVHAMYPTGSPDYPPRLLDRRHVNYERSSPVHEEPRGARSWTRLEESLEHVTFHDRAELERKLVFYSTLAAGQLARRNPSRPGSTLRAFLRAPAAFIKWYLRFSGWRDGRLGLTLSLYAARYTFLKHINSGRIAAARRREPK
jgi:glycosyltransferase involved in cell wall biosynthesis